MQYRAKRRVLNPAREAAYQALLAVVEDDAFINIALPRILNELRLRPRDRALATEIAYGVSRTQGRLDFIINHASSHPTDKLDPRILVLLRMGIYQLLEMRIPDHAAVAETVDMARYYTSDGPAKLTNAVLRNVTREDPAHWNELARAELPPAAAISVQFSHPEWIVRAFEESLRSRGYHDLIELLQADNAKPYVTLAARPGQITPAALADEVEEVLDADVAMGNYSPYAVTISGGNPGRLEALRAGAAAVQDEGSQLVAEIFNEVQLDLGSESRWLDMCAGPGGKTGMLAALAPAGVQIQANEVAAHRARLVERTVKPFANVEVTVGDGRDLGNTHANTFDRVLVDAPCSGLGALRRRPEARYRKSPDDLASLVPLQEELLRSAIAAVKPGGMVFYVTCSPHLSETSRIVDAAVAEEPVRLLDLSGYARRFNLDNPQQTIQLWPHHQGTDAMFMAALVKE